MTGVKFLPVAAPGIIYSLAVDRIAYIHVCNYISVTLKVNVEFVLNL